MVITLEQKGANHIIVFDRDNNNKRIDYTVTDFRPYFFVDDFNGEYESIYGEPLKKIDLVNSKDVYDEVKKYGRTFESDVKYTQRFLIDRIKVPLPKRDLRIHYLDIETNDSLDVLITPEPITCVTIYDNYDKKFYTFAWRKDMETKKIINENIIFLFDKEKDMLDSIIHFISEKDPDLLTGFNINYDISYLVVRAKKIGLMPNQISPMNYVKIDKFGAKVYGRVVFDIRKGYMKNFDDKNIGSYNLDNVAFHVLGRKKVEINMSPGVLWKNDFKKLLSYNYEDVNLLVDIDKKLSIIEFYDQRRRDVGCLWDRITSVGFVNGVEFLREAKSVNKVVPTLTEKKEIEHSEGADVMYPEPGIYSQTLFLDLKSEYPSFLCASNLSFETIDKDGDIRLGNGINILSEPRGILASIIERQIKRRDESKKLMKQCDYGSDEYKKHYLCQYSNKVLANSAYGLANSKYFLLQDKRITDCITWGGRELLNWSMDIVKKNGYKPVYADTDGIFIPLGDISFEETIKIGKFLEGKVNESYGDFCKKFNIPRNFFMIEFERIYRKFFIKTKKRYIGLLSYENGKKVNDKMVVKGYEMVRVDTADVCKEVQENVFRMIVEGKNKKEVDIYVESIKKKLKDGEYSIFQIGFPKPWKDREYKGKSFHIEAANYSNKYLGTDFAKGSRFMVVYVNYISGLPSVQAIAFDKKTVIPVGLVINWDKQMPVLIDNKISKIYEALGWTKEKSKPVGLDAFLDK